MHDYAARGAFQPDTVFLSDKVTATAVVSSVVDVGARVNRPDAGAKLGLVTAVDEEEATPWEDRTRIVFIYFDRRTA